MHDAAKLFVTEHSKLVKVQDGLGLDIGGRNVNGNCRTLFPKTTWTVIDKISDEFVSEGVNFIHADASQWVPDQAYDLVLCTEVLEHCINWESLLGVASTALKPGGSLILTCAGPGRSEHSGIDGGYLHPGEYYANIKPHLLGLRLRTLDFIGFVTYNFCEFDNYVYAIKR